MEMLTAEEAYPILKPIHGLTLEERMERLTVPVTESGCLLWLGHLNSRGYGQIRVNGKKEMAHRVAYEMKNGSIPHGMHVLHRCDTPLCCTPEHLFLGSHQDTMDDMAAKGRNGSAKLTETDIPIIRKMLADGIAGTIIAKKFGVGKVTISHIKGGKYWGHVK